MTNAERANWLDNIYSTANVVARELDWDTVRFVLNEYGGGATSIENLRTSYYESVWNALYNYEVDLKD